MSRENTFSQPTERPLSAEEFREKNPLFAPDTRLVIFDDHPQYTSRAVARTITRTLGQLPVPGNHTDSYRNRAFQLVDQIVSNPHSKKPYDFGLQPGQTVQFDPFDPRMGLIPDGTELPFDAFPISISRDETGYTAAVPFVGTEAVNPFRSEAYVHLSEIQGTVVAPKNYLKSDFFWNHVNHALAVLRLAVGPQHTSMYDALDRDFLNSLAMAMGRTGKTWTEVQSGSFTPELLEKTIKKLVGRKKMPSTILPLKGSFINETGNGIYTQIDIATNPVGIDIEPYLNGQMLSPDFGKITQLEKTVTTTAHWRTPVQDLIAEKRNAQEVARSLGLS